MTRAPFLTTIFRNDDSTNRRNNNNVSSTYTNRYDVFDFLGSHTFWVDIFPFSVEKSAKNSGICAQPGDISSNEDNRVHKVFFDLIKGSVA